MLLFSNPKCLLAKVKLGGQVGGGVGFEMGEGGLSTLWTVKNFMKPIIYRNYTESIFQDAITMPPTNATCFLDTQYIIQRSYRP